MVVGKVAWAVAGAVVTSAILLNPTEESFRHQVEHESKKRTGFIGGKLAKFATYVMQESEVLKFRNYFVCSVVTDETQPNRPAVVAVGAFGKWFFGDSFA
eukprot:Phypoly_transcript_24923.p1 GENE.Phypoly_transcript_24923~~Phypoly_transcript_24923.p1  ORF type:complete len:100 (+),score=17.84 Phypoly_transcript_24923:126-425(+)